MVWYTATDHTNCSESDQGQSTKFSENDGALGANEVEVVEEKGFIKGICPTGWHMPSDRELNLLEKELIEQADKYANGTYSATQKTWTDGWETTIVDRGTINGTVMKSNTEVEYSSYDLDGDSKISVAGGFDIFLAGDAFDGMPSGNYSDYGFLWSSSSNTSYSAWSRYFCNSDATVGRGDSGRRSLSSVRCKKD